jgi:hypothetical protein
MRSSVLVLSLASLASLAAMVACTTPGPRSPAAAAPAASSAAATPLPAPAPSAPDSRLPAPGAAGRAEETRCADTVVTTATTEPAGLKEEGRWLREHYPGWKKTGQALSAPDERGRIFDSIEITSATGEKKTVCFDITGFFGKW